VPTFGDFEKVHHIRRKEILEEDVVTVRRQDLGLVERYIRSREQQAADAHPALDYIDEDACVEAEKLKQRLSSIQPGKELASEYQRTILEILNYRLIPT